MDGEIFYFFYKILAKATVTRYYRSRTIQRKRKFNFIIECLMERKINASSQESFVVSAALVDADNEVKNSSLGFFQNVDLSLFVSMNLYFSPQERGI